MSKIKYLCDVKEFWSNFQIINVLMGFIIIIITIFFLRNNYYYYYYKQQQSGNSDFGFGNFIVELFLGQADGIFLLWAWLELD